MQNDATQTRIRYARVAGFGIFASVVVLFASIGNLVLPEYSGVIQFGWRPIFIAEITTGFWLLARGVKSGASVATDN